MEEKRYIPDGFFGCQYWPIDIFPYKAMVESLKNPSSESKAVSFFFSISPIPVEIRFNIATLDISALLSRLRFFRKK